MKKTFFLIICCVFTIGMFSQTDGITYQAVIIDTNPEQIPGVDIPSNNLPNVPLDVRFSILNDTNNLEYQEIQTTETDAYGMIHLTIGSGIMTGGSGAFNEIYWNNEKFLRVEIDLRDGSGFVLFSSQNLTYIPYVKHREIIATSTLDVDGITNLNNALNVNNESPTQLSGALTVDGITNLNDALNVNNQATTTLTGDLYVEGQAYFGDAEFDNIVVNENANLNVVDISGATTIDGPTVLNGTARLNGATEINNSLSVINGNSTALSGTLVVDGETNLNANLNVNNGSTTNLSGDLIVGGQAIFGDAEFENISVSENSNLNVLNVSGPATVDGPTLLNGTATLNGVTQINNSFSVINGNNSQLSGDLSVDGLTNLNSSLNVNNGSTTNLSGDLFVGGQAFFGDAGFDNITVSDLSSLNNLDVSGTATVAGATILNGTARMNGATEVNNSFNVINGNNSELSGNLIVDGLTNLNSNVSVNNGSATALSGTLDVTGASTLASSLDVGGITNLAGTLNVNNSSASNLSGNLTVDGVTNLEGEFNVNNDSASSLSGSLTVGGISNLNGQVTIDADVNGGQGSINSYPLRVRGSNQGIYIRVDGTTANSSNNFISFGDDTRIRGRIEGQTTSELQNSFEYAYFTFLTSFEVTFLVGMVAVDIAGFDDIDASVFEGIQAVQVAANGIVQTTHWNNNVGIAFESGSADYAEWLEKMRKAETFSYGDIVGVTGGKISKILQQPDHYMVISKSPLVLGNMPEAQRESDYEKVAFMGQVPVKVAGQVTIGDYIIPSGLQDGIGKGVSAKEIKISEYDQIIGVAWSETVDKGISYVNVAIGINANDTAALLEQQRQEITSLQKQIDGIVDYLAESDPSFKADGTYQTNSKRRQNSLSSGNTDEEEVEETSRTEFEEQPFNAHTSIGEILENNTEILDKFMTEVKARLDLQKVNYQQFDQINRLVTDRQYFLNFAKNYFKD